MTDHSSTTDTGRRRLLLGGAAGLAGGLAAPAIATAQGATTTWRVQTTWANGVGLDAFMAWCDSMVEKSGGELAFEGYKSGDLVGDFEVYDALRDGRIEAANPFTVYANRFTPAGVFLSSYPMAMRAPHEFDVFYYGLGGLEIAREIYAREGLFFVGPIHHGPNIIHSQKPLRFWSDFEGITMRTPGGMVADFFQALGANTVTLPGSEIFGAFERGEIQAADFVGPSANYAYGFSEVTDFISMGPPGYMSVYQPVDLMDLTVAMPAWEALSPRMKLLVEQEVHAYSDLHHAAIQAADQEAWALFEADGTRVARLTQEDVRVMTKIATPIWFDYAKRDPDAERIFRIQLAYMASGSLGYVDEVTVELFDSL
jgi:TRAP-type mannitol/chloroaromatic compound transport system substrate-binding protein